MSATLFVADLPNDVKEEDLGAMFREEDGYASSRLRTDKTSRVVGFVEFNSSEQAAAALERMEGKGMFPDAPPLRIQFAKAKSSAPPGPSMAGKRAREDDSFGPPQHPPNMRGYSYERDVHPRGSLGAPGRHVPVPPSDPMPGSASMGKAHPLPHYDAHLPRPPLPMAPSGQFGGPVDANPGAVPPEASSTLYVENVPSDATQRELSHIFRPYVGFQSVRLVPKEARRPGEPRRFLCFVEFDTVYHAHLARNQVQGYRMDKDDTRGLVVDFARNSRETRPPPGPVPPPADHTRPGMGHGRDEADAWGEGRGAEPRRSYYPRDNGHRSEDQGSDDDGRDRGRDQRPSRYLDDRDRMDDERARSPWDELDDQGGREWRRDRPRDDRQPERDSAFYDHDRGGARHRRDRDRGGGGDRDHDRDHYDEAPRRGASEFMDQVQGEPTKDHHYTGQEASFQLDCD